MSYKIMHFPVCENLLGDCKKNFFPSTISNLERLENGWSDQEDQDPEGCLNQERDEAQEQ